MADDDHVKFFESPVAFSPVRLLDPRAFPSGGAGMAGTASDVLKFLETLRAGGLLQSQTRGAMFTVQALTREHSATTLQCRPFSLSNFHKVKCTEDRAQRPSASGVRRAFRAMSRAHLMRDDERHLEGGRTLRLPHVRFFLRIDIGLVAGLIGYLAECVAFELGAVVDGGHQFVVSLIFHG
jgi:hypothetical protein